VSLEEIESKCKEITAFYVCVDCNLLRFVESKNEQICDKCKEPMFCINQEALKELDEELAR
jgi:hypothetical protein